MTPQEQELIKGLFDRLSHSNRDRATITTRAEAFWLHCGMEVARYESLRK